MPDIERRRAAAAAAWDVGDAVVLVAAGDEIPVPGRGDRTYPYRAHSEYLYLTDRERPGGVLAFDPGEGWVEFVVPVTADELLWTGLEGDREGVPEGAWPRDELEGWLAGRPARRLGATDDPDDALRNELIRVRRPKDDDELERMRIAAEATRAGFAELAGIVAPGRTERELQVALEAAFLRSGGDFLAFESIVAAGDHSAVLHFSPTARELRAGELLLVDAGAEHRGYASDVTRTYPAGGELTSEQAELHALVRAANLAAQARCTAGTEFTDIHWTAARVIAEGLAGLGLLKGDPDTLVERRTVSLFFPHGVGHMVGLGVRDAGGPAPGRTPRDDFPRLRADLPLEDGFAITIEPGIYFVPALLNDPERRAQHRDTVDWDRAERMLGFGGIRIEDNVLVTPRGPENLTRDIPLLA
jgi:Xaa-Pro aminopeptidase